MFSFKRIRLARITIVSILVYLCCIGAFLYYAQDALRRALYHGSAAQGDSTSLDMRSLSDALVAPVRNHYCKKQINLERRARYEQVFNMYVEEEMERKRRYGSELDVASPPLPTSLFTSRLFHQQQKYYRFNLSSEQQQNEDYRIREDGEHEHPMQVFIALNLHNNEDVIPDFLVQLLDLVHYLGRKNIFISIYESGSFDTTKVYLRFLEIFLSTWRVEYVIRTSPEKRSDSDHRIEYLARARNEAMRPLYDDVRGAQRRFQKVLFFNDIFFCADDVKELLYQSVHQRSDLTCAMDFDKAYPQLNPQLGFYDTWVARDMNGQAFRKPIDQIVPDEAANQKYLNGLPFQAQCCWNGVVVLNADAFYPPFSVRFRRDITHQADPKTNPNISELQMEYPNMPIYTSCSSSEINTLCKDLVHHGFDRTVIVPRVKVAYEWNVYEDLREQFNDELVRFDSREDSMIRYRPQPEVLECQPMDSVGVRGPDGVLGVEINYA